MSQGVKTVVWTEIESRPSWSSGYMAILSSCRPKIFWPSTHVSQLHARSVASVDGPRRGAHPEDDIGLCPDRCDARRGLAIPPLRQAIAPGPNGKCTRLAPVGCSVTGMETKGNGTKSLQRCSRSWGPWAPGPWT